jgi:hypothetical protein
MVTHANVMKAVCCSYETPRSFSLCKFEKLNVYRIKNVTLLIRQHFRIMRELFAFDSEVMNHTFEKGIKSHVRAKI